MEHMNGGMRWNGLFANVYEYYVYIITGQSSEYFHFVQIIKFSLWSVNSETFASLSPVNPMHSLRGIHARFPGWQYKMGAYFRRSLIGHYSNPGGDRRADYQCCPHNNMCFSVRALRGIFI